MNLTVQCAAHINMHSVCFHFLYEKFFFSFFPHCLFILPCMQGKKLNLNRRSSFFFGIEQKKIKRQKCILSCFLLRTLQKRGRERERNYCHPIYFDVFGEYFSSSIESFKLELKQKMNQYFQVAQPKWINSKMKLC